MHSVLDSFPIYVITEYRDVLCSRSLLVTYFIYIVSISPSLPGYPPPPRPSIDFVLVSVLNISLSYLIQVRLSKEKYLFLPFIDECHED